MYVYVTIICLFVWRFSSHSRIFHSYGDVTMTGEGLQILTYAWHVWSLSREGSLACHTYCYMGHPFIMVIFEDPWHTYCWAFSCGAVSTCFYDLGLTRLGFEHQTFCLRDQRSNPRSGFGPNCIIHLEWQICIRDCTLWYHTVRTQNGLSPCVCYIYMLYLLYSVRNEHAKRGIYSTFN